MPTAIFSFLSTPAGQAFLTAAMQIGGTIVADIAALVAAHAATAKATATEK
jgi:hypothetical protein